MTSTNKSARRQTRKFRIRKSVHGTPERLRLTVTRSLNNIYAQVIDDTKHHTVVAASSLDKEIAADIQAATSKIEQSKIVGKHLAKKAQGANITVVVFDRNGYLYHGRVKALADAARENGLSF